MADQPEDKLPTTHASDAPGSLPVKSEAKKPAGLTPPTSLAGAKRTVPGKKRRAGLPRTEAELNRPEPQTLWMLGVVCVATVIMWGAARAACNFHPPHESRRARAVTLAELTADPKNAAIEAVQRWSTKDFEGALAIATSTARAQIQADQKACDAKCKSAAKALKANVVTTAELLGISADRSLVRVLVTGAEPARSLLEVVREGATWKIAERKRDDGSASSATLGAAGAHP